MPLTVFAVDQKYGSLAHESQAIAHFTDRAMAERYAAKCAADAIANGWEYDGHTYTYDVEELTVDDPGVLAGLAGEAAG
jgi:hypothetical protein